MLASDPMLFALRQTWLTVSLLTAPRNRVVGARRTRHVLVGGGQIRARDQRVGGKRAPAGSHDGARLRWLRHRRVWPGRP